MALLPSFARKGSSERGNWVCFKQATQVKERKDKDDSVLKQRLCLTIQYVLYMMSTQEGWRRMQKLDRRKLISELIISRTGDYESIPLDY